MLQIKDAMCPVIHPLRTDMPLVDAVTTLLKSGYLGLPVVDKNLKIVGFLSEFDCLPHLLADSYHCDSHVTVETLMRRDPLVVKPNMSVVDLAQQMALDKPKVYAVEDQGKLVGVITRSMLMRTLNEALKQCNAVA
ncbi:CBS domain-containing protein [Neptuniibacter pectenicola]|mgnify:FL=1|jgi:CBS domain-containing protein|uniref:CBS domain-containing protein n=1 Tax=Neptuniibacter pectenicola TaxID=1806669 RepID=UPI000830887B|nr:CBS domain-containing protein [Neptuniibacter pectenicola]|tara:strand:+ start:3882 stop:4289 length:408 start_codon:yes stop_codon:yes gene_type:complete